MATALNGIATYNDFFHRTYRPMVMWDGNKKGITYDYASTYLNLTCSALPYNKLVKYEYLPYSSYLRTEPTYTIYVDASYETFPIIVDKTSAYCSDLYCLMDSIQIDGIAEYDHWRWDPSLNDDVYLGIITAPGKSKINEGATCIVPSGGSYDGGMYETYGFIRCYPDGNIQNVTGSKGYKYQIIFVNGPIESSSE